MLQAVQEFVDEHRHEPGFGFYMDYRASEHIPLIHTIPIERIVFDRWMSGEHPTYRVTIRDGKAHGELLNK